MLTLYTTPVIYLAMERLRPQRRPRRGAAAAAGALTRRVGFSTPFIRRPVGTVLLAIGLLIAGAVAYQFLPVASLPSVDIPPSSSW